MGPWLGLISAPACGGSSIEGSGIQRAVSPWVIGATEDNADVLDASDTEAVSPEQQAAPSPSEQGPTSGQDAKVEGPPTLDALPAPDGFPGPEERACPAGELCTLDSPEVCYEGRCNALGACIASPISGCCLDDGGCANLLPQSACQRFRCVDNACVPFDRPGCCSTSATCDDVESCTQDSCLNGPGGRCVNCPTECSCPGALALHVATFNEASLIAEGYGVNDQHFDEVTWRLSTRRFISPPTAAWLGHSECPTYYTGQLGLDCQPSADDELNGGPVQAELVGPAIAIPTSPGGHVASFWLWSDVEALSSGGNDERDVLRVAVIDLIDGVSWPASSSLHVGKSTGGAWQQMALDLSPWQGTTISLRFFFDTLDGSDNHHEGVYIDDLRVEARCKTGCCEFDADCPSDETSDACTQRRCVTLADGAGGTCLEVPALPGELCQVCANDASCDDDDPCTEDTCNALGQCEHLSFCCLEVSAYETSFEAGLGGWYVSDAQPSDNVTWVTSELSASAGSWAAWLGDPLTGTYESGGPVSAALQTPQIQLPEPSTEAGEVNLGFALNLSTEWDGFDYDNPAGVDRLRLELVVSGQEIIELWSSDEVSGSTQGVWVDISISLEAWAGQSIKLRFVFDTGDEVRNDYAGPRIDDLRIGRICP